MNYLKKNLKTLLERIMFSERPSGEDVKEAIEIQNKILNLNKFFGHGLVDMCGFVRMDIASRLCVNHAQCGNWVGDRENASYYCYPCERQEVKGRPTCGELPVHDELPSRSLQLRAEIASGKRPCPPPPSEGKEKGNAAKTSEFSKPPARATSSDAAMSLFEMEMIHLGGIWDKRFIGKPHQSSTLQGYIWDYIEGEWVDPEEYPDIKNVKYVKDSAIPYTSLKEI